VTYVLKHKDRWFTIGKHGSPWTVEGAREKAQSLLGQLAGGEDPRPPSAGTFDEAVTLYLTRRRSALRPKTFHEIERYLVTQAKALHPLELHEVNRRGIAELLAKIEQGSGPVRGTEFEHRSLPSSLGPSAKVYSKQIPLAVLARPEERSRERVLSPAELGKLWTTLVFGQHVHYLDIVRLLLLTGQRREEIGGLRWSEVDFDAKLIRLPPERTRNKREHIVPLSAPALAILRIRWAEARVASQASTVPQSNENDARVFVGFSWSIEKARFDKGVRLAPWRVHDIRRSVATHLADQGFATPHVVEAILNHVSGHKAAVAGTYNRARYLDECRAALERWANWIEANAA
jgi:integrase